MKIIIDRTKIIVDINFNTKSDHKGKNTLTEIRGEKRIYKVCFIEVSL